MPTSVTRRRAAAGLATLAAAGLAGRARAADDALLQAARKEGRLTWYVAQFDTETAEDFGRAFTAAHPGVHVDVVRTTGEVAYQRLMLDIRNDTPHCDVFSGTDIGQMPDLMARKALQPVTPAGFDQLQPTFQAQSERGWYYVTNAGRWALVRNRVKVPPDQAPKAWTDLLAPRWKGEVSIAHPAFSGGAAVWALAMTKLHGWAFFEALLKNNPRIGRSTIDTVTLLSAGECLVGPTWAPGAYHAIDRGNPIALDQPSDGVVLMVFPSAIPAHAPHPNAARLFLDWMLSEDYSRRIAAQGSEPLRAGVASRPDQPPLGSLKVITLSVQEVRDGVPKLVERWRDTF